MVDFYLENRKKIVVPTVYHILPYNNTLLGFCIIPQLICVYS